MTSPVLDFSALADRLARAPLHGWLGLRLEDLSEGSAVVGWQSSPLMPTLHPGVVNCLFDCAGSMPLIARTGQTVITLNCHVVFHAVCEAQAVRAASQVVHDDGKLATVAVRVLDDTGALVASGQAVYKHLTLAPDETMKNRTAGVLRAART